MGKHGNEYARTERNFYPTPAWVVAALAEHIELAGLKVWEPAAGDGRMVKALKAAGATVYGSDIHPHPGFRTLDFLAAVPRFGFDAIITNPPGGEGNRLAEQFVEIGLRHIAGGGLLALLLPNDFDSAKSRRHLFADCSAFTSKIVLTRRIVWFPPQPGKKAAPRENHSWFIWQRPSGAGAHPSIFYAPGPKQQLEKFSAPRFATIEEARVGIQKLWRDLAFPNNETKKTKSQGQTRPDRRRGQRPCICKIRRTKKEERNMYHPTRDESESTIRLLAEKYPRCFFEDPKQRRPLKKNLISDLEKDGAPVAAELLSSAVAWYKSHFSYRYALQAGAKRIDLNGKEVTTVTELEAKNAQKYIHEQKLKARDKYKVESPVMIVRQLHANGKIPTDQLSKITAPPLKMPALKMPTMKEATMINANKPIDPFAAIEQLLDGVRAAFTEQPEALRRPLAAAGLRVVITEIEKTIAGLDAA